MKTNKLTLLALFTTLALALYYVETLIPNPIPIPGVKLGLANIIILVILSKYTPRDAFFVLLVRILIQTLLFGQFLSFAYSLVGGMLCLVIEMLLLRFLKNRFIYLVAIAGAIMHNVAQLAVCLLITKTIAVTAYLPYMILSAILTGLFTGLVSHYMLRLLNKHLQ